MDKKEPFITVSKCWDYAVRIIPQQTELWKHVTVDSTLTIRWTKDAAITPFPWTGQFVISTPSKPTQTELLIDRFDCIRSECLVADGVTVYKIVGKLCDDIGGTNSIHQQPHIEFALEHVRNDAVYTTNKETDLNTVGTTIPMMLFSIAAWYLVTIFE
jgi:hypothetical protein